jgi:solute carrier family 25 (mitochondrial phosphate transporter), member 3
MQSFFPAASTLSATFGHSAPYKFNAPAQQAKRTPYQARTELFPSWNVAEDAKQKGAQLSDAAVKEFEKASASAQAKAGKIELYSGKYYAVGQIDHQTRAKVINTSTH